MQEESEYLSINEPWHGSTTFIDREKTERVYFSPAATSKSRDALLQVNERLQRLMIAASSHQRESGLRETLRRIRDSGPGG